jgi:hypothetical protein
MDTSAEYKITKNIFGNSVLKTFSLDILPVCRSVGIHYSLYQE